MKKLTGLCLIIMIVFVFAVSSACAVSGEAALAVICENSDLWLKTDEWTHFWYAVTDLDGNGRPEIFAADTEGTGIFTTGWMYEVNEAGNGLNEVILMPGEYEVEFIADVIVDKTDCYIDPVSGKRSYIFSDTVRNGAWGSYTTMQVWSLSGGKMTVTDIAFADCTTDGQNPAAPVYSDLNGNVITEEEYYAAPDRFLGNIQKTTAHFGWFDTQEGSLTDQIRQSYAAFKGMGSEVPVGSNGNILITKNPTSESLAIGGNTWFIAHATGADTLTWQLVDGNRNVYSTKEAMAAHPGLELEVLEGDTIAVRNAPESLNGWSVQAVFANNSFACATEPAAVYVGDYVTKYSSVIEQYQRASATPRDQFGYGVAVELGVSEILGYSDHCGYAMKDLDKDGIPELIIAGMGENDYSDRIIYEIYTLVNDTPVALCTSQARDRYYLRTDSTVYRCGSGGWATTCYDTYRLKNNTLEHVESLMSDWDEPSESIVWVYDSGYGDVSYDADAALAMVEDWESRIYVPFLTKIA